MRKYQTGGAKPIKPGLAKKPLAKKSSATPRPIGPRESFTGYMELVGMGLKRGGRVKAQKGKSVQKKPQKYYSEIAVGKGDYSKPRTEKQQKEWEEAELRMIDPSYWSKPAPKKAVVKKSKTGSSLGMKSVKAGYDKNPGITRADIIVAGKGKAKRGTALKKAKSGVSMTRMANMKKGGKCKYGC